MESYRTIANEIIEYEQPAADVVAFLARVIDATHNPNVSASQLTDLIYGKENPLLDQTILPTSGIVTRAVFDNPLYRVMTDLLGRKRAEQHVARPPESATDLTVKEAATQIGVTYSAVQQAVASGRIRAEKRGGIYFLKRADVEAYRPVRGRGPAPRGLDVRVGNVPGTSFRVKVSGGEIDVRERNGHAVSGRVDVFKRVAVLSGGKGKYRYFELEPGKSEASLDLGDFYVRGCFRFAAKVNNTSKAMKAWRAFDGEDPQDAAVGDE